MNLIDALDIRLLELTTTGFKAEMLLSDFHAQPQGYLNGGATLAFAEISAGMASTKLVSPDAFAVGTTVEGHHLTAIKAKGKIVAVADLLHQSKHRHLWDIRILDQKGQIVCKVLVENAILKVQN
ncbi:MAG: PaaI family thioesterase [Lactococcus sp.]